MKNIPIVYVINGKIPINTNITIHGWVRTRRDSKSGISFINVYDGSCFDSLQIIAKNNLSNYKNEIIHLTTGCSVKIKGFIKESYGKKQKYEMKANEIQILGWIDNPETYPISAKYHSAEYLREIAHLRARTNLIGAITRIRHTVTYTIHKFMNEQGFFWVSTPLITSLDTEGSGEMFQVSKFDLNNIPYKYDNEIDYKKDFFGKKAFLTVSGQLNGECYACAISKIYTFGPTFRANYSKTTKHLAEFWMVEPEVAFADLEDIIILAETMLKYILETILLLRYDDINFLQKYFNKQIINNLKKNINNKLTQINYNKVIDILKNNNKLFKKKITWGMDLSPEHENFLTTTYFKSPIVIKNYPKEIKAFYMRINNDNKTVAAMDIIVPKIGEIIGGSQREERLNEFDNRLIEMKIKKEDYWWYRDLRRYGTVPHSGFGLGLERLIAYITGINNIQDIIPFPRSLENLNF